MRVDEKTKEVIQEWSLTNIKRWAASPKSFTLVGASPSPPARPPSCPPPWGCLALLPLPLLAPRWVDGGAEPCSWHSSWPRVLSTYQRGSGRAQAPCPGATLCHAVAGFRRLPGWLLLRADNGGGADRPADRRLHRHHPEKGECLGVRGACLQLAPLLGVLQGAPWARSAAGGAGDVPWGFGGAPAWAAVGRCTQADVFSLHLHRKRARITSVWRVMRSPPCWRTRCLPRSKRAVLRDGCSPRHPAGTLHPRGACTRRRCWFGEVCPSVPGSTCCFFSPHFRSTVLQQQFNRVGKAELGSVALPAIMRTGAGGPENFQVGTMPQAQLQITSGQMHRGHMPPLVRAPLCPPLWGAGTCGAVPAAVVRGAAFLLLGGLPSSSSSSAAKEMFEQGHKESVTLSGPQPAPSKSFVSSQSASAPRELVVGWVPHWASNLEWDGAFPIGGAEWRLPPFCCLPPFFYVSSFPERFPSPCPCLADFSPAGADGHHQLQHAGCERSPGHPG